MKLMTALIPLVLTTSAVAAPLNLKISGMHCGSCEASIEKEICANGNFAKCEANVRDSKAQIGELTIETRPGQTADVGDITRRVEKLGYKVETAPATPAPKK